ncbi:hypothetical protein ACGFYZ_40985 [Streptomyces sp. NPDC048330]|uniref:hypothetical protein n=1 Tax=Streptomyces sp. NPDC048330 TaxID=3365533 RepID=UPI00372062CF
MDTMSVDSLDELDVTDHYTEALHEVIEAKAEHRAPTPAAGEEKEPAPVVDLMAALGKSVTEARAARGEGPAGAEATVHEMPKPKKTAAKRTAAKKATAKKTSPSRRPKKTA